MSHGWKPETGFLRYRWQGYNEALILYVLGLGSPTHPLPAKSYRSWTSTYRWKRLYGYEFVYGAALFMHQLPQVWIDFRGIQDGFMRRHASDYFENSRRATYVNQHYAMRNPRGFRDYGEHVWGITASNGPGPATRRVKGVTRRFFGYRARGVPYGPDDGTLAPWAVAASLPFAPEIVLPTLQHYSAAYPKMKASTGSSAVSIRRFRHLVPGRPVGSPEPLRARSGTGHSHDRELSFRVDLAAHAGLSICREGPAPCRLQSDRGPDQSGFSDFIRSISSGVIFGT